MHNWIFLWKVKNRKQLGYQKQFWIKGSCHDTNNVFCNWYCCGKPVPWNSGVTNTLRCHLSSCFFRGFIPSSMLRFSQWCCRHGLENFQLEYWIPLLQNRWCIATQKSIVRNSWRACHQQKLHCSIGLSIWWQMSCSMKITTRWTHATLLWSLHPTWLRLV